MTNISQHLPEQSKTVEAIYAAYKRAGEAEPTRGYLGASIIGHSCSRYLWYCFRQCCKPSFDGRMYRLFETGNLAEARFVKDLRDIGCTVHDCDAEGEQFEVSAFGGHFSGHMDGCALGIPGAPKTWHVLEFKTHNAKSFRKLLKEGVQKSKPIHYAQKQIYMHRTGMKRALYLAVNKDTDELYSERIRYDKSEAEALMGRAKRIITATSPPDKISTRKDYYQCGWCDAKEICWGSEESALPVSSLSCRQCCHATPQLNSQDAKWDCRKHNLVLVDGKRGCKHHLVLPGLLESFAEPTDYATNDTGNNFIEFTNTDGTTWKHGNTDGCYSSKELMKLPVSTLGNKMIQTAKELFNASVIDCQEDILSRYPVEDSRIVWGGPVNCFIEAWRATYIEDIFSLEPLAKYTSTDYQAIEFEGSRVAILWSDGTAEVRESLG